MKLYFLAKTKASKFIGVCSVAEIAALLNANKIQEDYVATECSETITSYEQLMNSGHALCEPVSTLLAATYEDKPLITVAIKDAENNTFLLSERYHSDGGPSQAALGATANYFDQHFNDYSNTSPKDFLVYFKSEKCPPTVMTIKLKVESHTVKKCVTGSGEDPWEETYPYQLVERDRRTVESSEFPPDALELKPPKYDPAAPLPRFAPNAKTIL